MAGVPFEILENLATVATAEAAREFLVRQAEFAKAKSAVERLLDSRKHNLSKEQFRSWRKAIRSGVMPPAVDPPSSAFASCWDCASNLAAAEARLEQSLQDSLRGVREGSFEAARKVLPPYLLFAAGGVRETPEILQNNSPPPPGLCPRATNKREPMSDTCFFILQRICGKNDSLSEFGPQGWGSIEGKGGGS